MEFQTDDSFISKNLDHLGIVASVCKDIGLIDTIDNLTDSDPQRNVSVGEAVYAMILNGLGFSNRTLYLTPEFFKDKPIEILMGKDFQASHFNDDSLGRALDACYSTGVEKIFYNISSQAINKYDVDVESRHLDGTTFSVTGDKYKSEHGTIEIRQGYNKQKRHDLPQFVFQLISANREGIPLFFKPCSGNCSDKTEFPKVFEEYFSHMESANKESIGDYYYVADSALYGKDNIKSLKKIKWITRVPETLKKAIEALNNSVYGTWSKFPGHEGYQYQEKIVYYGGIRQYWLIVLSEEAKKRETKSLLAIITKEHSEINKSIDKLSKKRFESAKEARMAFKELKANTKLKYHEIQTSTVSRHGCYKAGRRKANAKPERYEYTITTTVEEKTKEIELEMQRKGKFILATNEIAPANKKKKQNSEPIIKPSEPEASKPIPEQINSEKAEKEQLNPIESKLTPDEFLKKYKNDQQQVERGFRFLKDPLFLLDHIFLKLPHRIMALSMVMALCLLVYTLAQFRLRKLLKEQNKTVPNQVKKEIQNPTIRWVFQLFQGIHVLYIKTQKDTKKRVVNIDRTQHKIIKVLGSATGIHYCV